MMRHSVHCNTVIHWYLFPFDSWQVINVTFQSSRIKVEDHWSVYKNTFTPIAITYRCIHRSINISIVYSNTFKNLAKKKVINPQNHFLLIALWQRCPGLLTNRKCAIKLQQINQPHFTLHYTYFTILVYSCLKWHVFVQFCLFLSKLV